MEISCQAMDISVSAMEISVSAMEISVSAMDISVNLNILLNDRKLHDLPNGEQSDDRNHDPQNHALNHRFQTDGF